MRTSIGVSFPESILPGTPLPDIAGLARLAEQAGLDGVWVADRLATGELSVLDSGLSLAVAAAVTSSIAVGYGVYVPSLRPLAWAAKQVATLQHIARGRLQLGVAIGGGGDAEYLLSSVLGAPGRRPPAPDVVGAWWHAAFQGARACGEAGRRGGGGPCASGRHLRAAGFLLLCRRPPRAAGGPVNAQTRVLWLESTAHAPRRDQETAG
jgi:alkanesulfonate monooxygenase SsuD/methylene tetrahydromethanopterin reductase-like flavin-dependent oxidoreductase (luciferase family)